MTAVACRSLLSTCTTRKLKPILSMTRLIGTCAFDAINKRNRYANSFPDT